MIAVKIACIFFWGGRRTNLQRPPVAGGPPRLGDRSFPVAATRAWNVLPDFVTAAPNVASFVLCRAEDVSVFSLILTMTDTRHTDFITWSTLIMSCDDDDC